MQLDHVNIASTAYVLLTGTYMKLGRNREGQHFPQGSLKRWINLDLWTGFFTAFLNLPGPLDLTQLVEWRLKFQAEFCKKNKAFKEAVSFLAMRR